MMIHRTGKEGVRSGLMACLAVVSLTVSACAADPFNRPVAQDSPASRRALEVEQANLPYPMWSRFPAAPKAVPAPAAYAAAAQSLDADQRGLLADESHLQWTLCCTEQWAAQTRSAIDPSLTAPAPTDEQTKAEAFVKAMREKATPPVRAPK